MTRLRARLGDVAAVVVVTTFVSLVSQRWTGFTSPDSEFYASLALFGSDVTDRAFEPSYYWTRLGYIAPVRVLTQAFGAWIGFEIWRVFLLLLIIGATYSVVHVAGRSRSLAILLAALVGLNTVLLAFVGNTYLTGSIQAAMFVLVALAVTQLGHEANSGRSFVGGSRWITAAVGGGVAGWLVMLNPYGFVLGVGMWAGVRMVVLLRLSQQRWKRLGLDVLAFSLGLTFSFLTFVLIGGLLFPGKSWWGTYLEWNSRLDYSVFVGDATTWQRDTALLLVVVSLVAAVVSVVAQPKHRWAWAALAVAGTNILITVGLLIFLPGPWLESPAYVAKLWPGTLLALSLVFTSFSPGTFEGKRIFPLVTVGVGLVGIALVIWAGYFTGPLPYSLGLILSAFTLALIVGVAIIVRSRWNLAVAIALTCTVVITFTAGQLLQNGRGLLGSYGQYPFRSAFTNFDYREQMASKIAAQQWLLERTNREDTIMIWTDTEWLTADLAAMQLWGNDNLVTVGETLTRDESRRLEEIQPTVIAMYAPSRAQIDRFYSSIPPWALPSPVDCTRVPYLGVGTGEAFACVTDLTWLN